MIQKLVKEKKEANLDLQIYYNKEMGLDKKKIIFKKKKKNCDWNTTLLVVNYILQYNYKKTRRGWILWLHDALWKIWFFTGGKWPWIKVSDELLTDKKNQWKK